MPKAARILTDARNRLVDTMDGASPSLVPGRPLQQAEPARTTREPGAASEELSVAVVHDRETLRGMQATWQDLADDACEANPFYEPWAALPAMEAFRPDLEVVCVSRPHPSLRKGERQLCGLFPIERRRASGPLAVPMISLWRHPYAYLGVPLVRAGLQREVVSCFFDWMAEGARRRGLLRIEDLPGDGPLRIAMVDELGRRGWLHTITQTYTRAFLRPAASAEAYVEDVIPGKKRKEYRRQQQRLAEGGVLEWRELQPEEDALKWAHEFSMLESRGWKGLDEVDVASRTAHLQYLVQLVQSASQQRRCMALSLCFNGQPIAMKLNMLSRQGSVAFKITYDESWARFSPGVLLELENIRRVHGRPDIPWMDSCAAPNRAMINRLWGDRREMQTVLIATDDAFSSLVVSAMPPIRWISRKLRRSKPQEVSHEE